MRLDGTGCFRRVPGWISTARVEEEDEELEKRDEEADDDDEKDEEESDLLAHSQKGLQDVLTALGDRWVDVPYIEFTPVHLTDGSRPRPPPSKWGTSGPLPSFCMERVRAPIVQETFIANGLHPTRGKDWLVMWTGQRMRESGYHGLHEFQRVNHFPGSTELTRKDRLCVHFNRMARRFGEAAYDFVPETYVLPEQMEEFLEAYETGQHLWIMKPHASSQGRGISILRQLEDIDQSEGNITVVSRYVDNPLLIQGLKFDLRVYVLVTSFEPLRAYVYREGLARFASKPYSLQEEHLTDLYRHLTNYSINKYADNFVENQNVQADNVGHKWSFSALNKHLKCMGVDTQVVWTRIMDLVLKTLLSVRTTIVAETHKVTPHSSNCFELYGFDVLVDETLKPWLLEVNLSPSMVADSPLDRHVKSAVLSDTFNLVGVCHTNWRTLATAKLRAQILQVRHTMGNTHLPSSRAAAIMPRNKAMFDRFILAGLGTTMRHPPGRGDRHAAVVEGHGADLDGSPPPLGTLTEDELKCLEGALREVKRCRNFIRLYPTRTTVERYDQLITGQTVVARHLKAMLFGYIPSRAQAKGPPPPLLPPIGGSSSRPGSGASLRKSRPSSTGNGRPQSQSSEEEPPADWSGLPCKFEHDPDRAASSIQTLTALGAKASSRLTLLEYLLRITSICSALHPTERAAVARSTARRPLAGFRQQLSVLVRTRVTTALPPLPGGRGTGASDDDADFIGAIVAACYAGVSCLSRELGIVRPISPEAGAAPAKLMQLLPDAFARSSRGEQATAVLTALSSSDLEFVLRSHQFAPEFLSLVSPCDDDEQQDDEDDDDEEDEDEEKKPHGAPEERPGAANSLLRQMFLCSGTPCGPLTELILALPERQQKSVLTDAVQPQAPPHPAAGRLLPQLRGDPAMSAPVSLLWSGAPGAPRPPVESVGGLLLGGAQHAGSKDSQLGRSRSVPQMWSARQLPELVPYSRYRESSGTGGLKQLKALQKSLPMRADELSLDIEF